MALPTPATSIADTLVAGDSFMSGVLVALSARSLLGPRASEPLSAMTRYELTEVVPFALRCAAITVSRQGADPPRVEDLG